MLILISPAKTLDFTPIDVDYKVSKPMFIDELDILINRLRRLSSADIANLMGVSEKIAALNYQRFQEFDTLPQKAALLAYKGDVYRGFELDQYSEDEFARAQHTLCILSGLYGILRPLDEIKPYRLEMSTSLEFDNYKGLYKFWGNKITNQINNLSKQASHRHIINLASLEYAKVIDPKLLSVPMTTIDFKQNRDGKLKTIGLLAKRARGKMANFIIRHDIQTIEALKDYDLDGYKFASNLSDAGNMVFVA